jgi:lipoprotein-anchoring transpeptidase ErfK/SrfK
VTGGRGRPAGQPPPRLPGWRGLAAAATVVLVLGLRVVSDTGIATRVTAGQHDAETQVVVVGPVAVPFVSAALLAALPEVSTTANLPAAPRDTAGAAGDVGGALVVHNTRPVPVFDAPGGTPFARLPTRQLGSDTWLPVIAEQPGWVRVLLPARPNAATGWLDADAVRTARTPYQVRVSLEGASLRLLRDGHQVGRWPVAVGATQTPTPSGRTFLLASITDPLQPYSRVIVPLGIHSVALHDYDGGPATVALHSWPTADVYGKPVSHGCLRLPVAAMAALATVPLGTVVLIA